MNHVYPAGELQARAAELAAQIAANGPIAVQSAKQSIDGTYLRELPAWLGKLHPRFHVPRHAVIAIGLITFGLVLVFDLRQILPLASAYLLVWFAITHYSALQLSAEQRLTSRFFSWFGLVGCFVLLLFIPPLLLTIGAMTLVLALGTRYLVLRSGRTSQRRLLRPPPPAGL